MDRGKIQTELDQLKDQLLSIATSASFNGVNWLNTDAPENLWGLSSLPTSITSSFIRSADGSVRVGTTDIDVADISLFNVGGGVPYRKISARSGTSADFGIPLPTPTGLGDARIGK